MEYNLAKKEIKRISKNKIIGSTIVIAILIYVFYIFNHSLFNLYIKGEEFGILEEMEKIYSGKSIYVETNAEELLDTGYVMYENNKITNKYYIMYKEDGYIIVRANKNMEQESYSNYKIKAEVITPNAEEKEILNRIIREISETQEISITEASNYISPYMLDIDSNRLLKQIVTAIGIIAVIYFIYTIILSIRDIIDYTKSKQYIKMKINDTKDSDWVNESVSEDFSKEEYIYNNKRTKITKKWIVSKRFSKFEVIPSEDLIWIYKAITQHRTNGIPTGKSYAIALKFKNKKMVNVVQKNEKKANETIEILQKDLKKVVYGYSDELLEIYNNNIEQFIEIAEKVEEK